MPEQSYMLQWQNTTADLAWEYRFTMWSDDAAIEYATRHLRRISGCSGLYVWRLGKEEGDARMIAVLTRGEVKINVAVDKG